MRYVQYDEEKWVTLTVQIYNVYITSLFWYIIKGNRALVCREGCWNTCMLKSTINFFSSNHCQIPVKVSRAQSPQLIKNKKAFRCWISSSEKNDQDLAATEKKSHGSNKT